MKLSLFDWYINMWTTKPLSAAEMTIFLVLLPVFWLFQRFYIRRHQIGLSNMIFGHGNEWALGKKTGFASDVVFSGFLGMVGARWLLENWMKIWKWSETRKQKRRELMLESAIFYRHVMTGDNYLKLKKAYPFYLWLNYTFLFLCFILIACGILSAYFSS